MSTKHNFTFLMVHPSMIRVDEKYQRQLDYARVKRIAKNWRDDIVNPPKLSLRADGFYYVFDGQHTLAAWKQVYSNDEPIMCQVYQGLTWNEEMELFISQRGYCSDPTTNDKLHALYEAGDEKVVEFVNAAGSCSVRIDFTKGQGIRKVSATSAAYAVFNDIGVIKFKNVLTVINEVWHGVANSYDARILRGLGILYKEFGDQFTNGQLIKALSSTDAKELIQDSRKYGGKPRALTYAVIDRFNYKKKEQNRIKADYVSLA